MCRIILITTIDEETGKLVVSHGINEDTLEMVITSQEHPCLLGGAYYDHIIGEWVIPDRD